MENMRIQEYATIKSDNLSDDGVIHDVPVLGLMSKNGRTYTEEALKEGVELYQDRPIFSDHGKGSRKVSEKLGIIKNVAYSEEHKQLRGDMHLLTKHPMFPLIHQDVSEGLGLYGLSHDASVSGEQNEEGITITKINRVFSTDLVAQAATVTNLREDEDPLVNINEQIDAKIKEQVEDVLDAVVIAKLKDAMEAVAVAAVNKALDEQVSEAVDTVLQNRLANTGVEDYKETTTDQTKPVFTVPTDKSAARSFLFSL